MERKERVLYSNYNVSEDYECAKEILLKNGFEEDDITETMIWESYNDQKSIEWEDFETEMESFLTGKRFLLIGYVGRWDGRAAGGFDFKQFKDLYKCWEDCDYIKVYDVDGHLYIDCAHHDGSNHFEIRELTEKGEDYLENQAYNWNVSDREVHQRIFSDSHYSHLPRYAEKVWGCPRREAA